MLRFSKVILGRISTCDSARPLWLYSAAPLADQATGTTCDLMLRHWSPAFESYDPPKQETESQLIQPSNLVNDLLQGTLTAAL